MSKDNEQTSLIKQLINEAVKEAFADDTRVARPGGVQRQQNTQDSVVSFDLNVLKQKKTLQEVNEYIQSSTLVKSFVGEGSSRSVYKYSDRLALKVAKNEAGIGQNREEKVACSIESTKNLFTKIQEVGPGDMWILVEFAGPINDKLFQKYIGIPWNEFNLALQGAFPQYVSSPSVEKTQMFQKYKKNPFFFSLLMTIKSCKYLPGDLAKLDSWGLTTDGRVVIVDSGFTEAVNLAHYKSTQSATQK